MLVRDAIDAGDVAGPGIEVCMLRRNLASEFVAGAYVFPGGSVDPEDRSPEALALCDGRDDAGASARLGVEAGGLVRLRNSRDPPSKGRSFVPFRKGG